MPDNEAMSTVLVVDDEPVVRDVVVRYLEQDGYRTLQAADGDSARELLEQETPSLVVLDLMLPGHRRAGPLPLDPRALASCR